MTIEKLRENDKLILYCVMQGSTRTSPGTANRTAFKITLQNVYRHAMQQNY